MKTYLTYGFAFAVSGAILTFALYLLGFHSEPARFSLGQTISVVALGLIAIACIVLGTKARRATVPADEEFGYGRALGAGVMISLFAGLFGIVTNYLYMQHINPEFKDVLVAVQREKWETIGMSSQQIEGAESVMRKMLHPAIQAVSSFVGTVVTGTVLSLIIAAFLKRPAAPLAANTPPVQS